MKLVAILARNVRERRRELGLTQEALAERCGLHPTYISGIETGDRNPSLNALEKLAASLELPAHHLLERD
ncbi:helix-turn-helix domain-containing protein [Maricaulis sp.]|uniref:helix-turn-helix domain-containing protein n=1 Tax=Maricaulis sp. TaxID=1486257 RepID=UPI003A91CAEE